MSRRYALVPTMPPLRTCQAPWVTSFIGGRPKLPPSQEIPTCGLCGAGQTFYLQVAFPDRHEWAGLTLAIFQCTSCLDIDRMMPPLTYSRPPAGEDIPDGALDAAPTGYRFLVFPTAEGVVRAEYEERIRYQPIELVTKAPAVEVVPKFPAVQSRTHIGGKPRWVHGDETPGRYEGEPLAFLLQWEEWFDFPAVPGAPRQYDPSDALLGDTPRLNNYSLFVSNEVYLFGNRARGKTNIYAVLQNC